MDLIFKRVEDVGGHNNVYRSFPYSWYDCPADGSETAKMLENFYKSFFYKNYELYLCIMSMLKLSLYGKNLERSLWILGHA